MTQPQTTGYMGILLPTIEISQDYPELLANALTLIDEHDHDQDGKTLTEKSVVWGKWDVSSKSLKNTSTLSFDFQEAIPFAINELYFKKDSVGIDLFYRNAAADIRITQRGAVSFYQPVDGFYGNFSIANASVVYSSLDNSYTFNIGDNLGSIQAFHVNVFFEMIGDTFIATIPTAYDIESTGFFYDIDSVLCTEGSPASNIKFESTQIGLPINVSTNPRLITSVDRFNNVQTFPNVYFRQTRYAGPGTSALRTFGGITTSNTCVITLLRGGFTSTNYSSVADYQTPAEETYSQRSTIPTHNLGAVAKINPLFTGSIGEVEAYALFKTGVVFPDPLMMSGNKMFHLTIQVEDHNVNPSVSVFSEYHAFDAYPLTPDLQSMAYQAYFRFQVIDLNTSLPITGYFAMLRI